MRDKIIQVRLDEENKKIIEDAASKNNLPTASFLRMIGIKESNKILLEEREV